jgi:YHS domain-containing protein
MKSQIISVVFLMASVLITSSTQADIPECIQKKIDGIKAGPVWNPPATISRYSYRGQTMYLASSNCCDQFNYLVDASCNRICAPSGGFTGRGDGKCMDFLQTGEFLGTLWGDTRSRGKQTVV